MPLELAPIRAILEQIEAYEVAVPQMLAEVDRIISELAAKDAEIARLQECAETARSAHEDSCDRAREQEGLRIHAETDLMAAQAKIARLRPVVEWHPDGHGWEAAHVGSFVLKLQTGSKCAGWRLFFGDARVTDGPETGEPGKAACFAAYLRACGMGGK